VFIISTSPLLGKRHHSSGAGSGIHVPTNPVVSISSNGSAQEVALVTKSGL